MNNIQITHLLHLHEASIQNKLVVFVGAGVSANSGVPTWSSLTMAFKEELPGSINKETDCCDLCVCNGSRYNLSCHIILYAIRVY